MKNFLLSIVFAIVLTGCNQDTKSKAANENKSITFSGIEAIAAKPKTVVEKYLKQHDFKFQSYEDSIYTWKAKTNSSQVIFGDNDVNTGSLNFTTQSKSQYDFLINQMKQQKFINTDVQGTETIKMYTYEKDEKSIMVTVIPDYENGKSMFSIHFLY